MGRVDTKAAQIARQLVHSAMKTYVPEDVESAVDKAIFKFMTNMREAAKEEMRYAKMRKISPNSGI